MKKEVKEVIYNKTSKPSKQSLKDSLDFFSNLYVDIPKKYRESSYIKTSIIDSELSTEVGFYREETDLEAAKRIVENEKAQEELDEKEYETFFSLLNKFASQGKLDFDIVNLNEMCINEDTKEQE